MNSRVGIRPNKLQNREAKSLFLSAKWQELTCPKITARLDLNLKVAAKFSSPLYVVEDSFLNIQ
jgi:hypothetical protein